MINENGESKSALDQYVAPGLRLWMLIGLVSGVLLIMTVIVCCFMKIRIPRTKRQIELIAARRKLRKQGQLTANLPVSDPFDDRRGQAIVMNSLAVRPGKSDRIHSAGTNGHQRREPLKSRSEDV
ncbi:hypothetical protein M3Y97_01141200 [Aphelenchoides bicaudatus]|nr:hypothetical protein M3Y97_01141200 [Aphelenchoides bicaudatus]